MIKMLQPRLKPQRTAVAVPTKTADPFYRSTDWRALRVFVLERDGHRCAVPGCVERASVVDHVKSRRFGGTDDPDNLRSLCRAHDYRFRERPDGKRKG
jgi:5-methylcytosine-specific restriction endonuclease McrA